MNRPTVLLGQTGLTVLAKPDGTPLGFANLTQANRAADAAKVEGFHCYTRALRRPFYVVVLVNLDSCSVCQRPIKGLSADDGEGGTRHHDRGVCYGYNEPQGQP